jgi:hypothetical protein
MSDNSNEKKNSSGRIDSMIDLGRMKVPIIEDKKGNVTWSLLVGDISITDKGVDLNHIDVEGYHGNDERYKFSLTLYASGRSAILFCGMGDDEAVLDNKDDYTSFVMAMSIAREYAVDQLGKEIKRKLKEEYDSKKIDFVEYEVKSNNINGSS